MNKICCLLGPQNVKNLHFSLLVPFTSNSKIICTNEQNVVKKEN